MTTSGSRTICRDDNLRMMVVVIGSWIWGGIEVEIGGRGESRGTARGTWENRVCDSGDNGDSIGSGTTTGGMTMVVG